jgi:hypothetical protein
LRSAAGEEATGEARLETLSCESASDEAQPQKLGR